MVPSKRQAGSSDFGSLQIRKAVKALKAMPITGRLEILVKSGQLTPEEAEQAKAKRAERPSQQ